MKNVFVLLAVFLCSAQIIAQNVITGKVTDMDGEPLPGVNILIKGISGAGTITNLDGIYSIEIPEEAAFMIFSFTGMKSKEVEITGSVINVTMENQDQLVGDVVVTALGISKETKKLGYAIDDVDGDAMLKSRQSNPINALNGRIAGANIVNSSGDVGASSSIVLRGYTSLAVGENQPLFIVDGIPYDNTTSKVARRGYDLGNSVDYGNAISDINPDDIESVSVLKGAAASALYGSRAQNGVILITTKSGKDSKGLNISYSYDVGMKNPLRLPDFQNEYGQGYLDDDPDSNTYGEYYYTMSADESWGPKLDAGLMIIQPWISDEPQPWISHPENIKNFLKTGISQNHNLSISFGGDKTSGRISYTGTRETGMLENTKHNKDNFALNLNTKLNNKISVSTNIKYSISNTPNSNGTAYGGSGARNVFNNAIWSGRQVDFNHPNLRNYWLDKGNRIQRNWNTSFWNNPYFQLYENLNIMKRSRFNGLIKVNFKITEDLSAFVRLGTDRYTRSKEERFAMGSRYDEDGSMWKQTYLFQESNADFLISYNKNFSEKLNFTASVGGNLMDQASNNKEVTTTAFVIPDLYSTAATAGSDAQSFYTYDTRRQIRSLYGILDIEVPFGVNLGFNYRQDWSSTLPVNNNSYGYFSTNLAWVATDAIELPNIFDLLKIRVNYSEVGADTDPYQLITPFVQSTTEIRSIPGYSLSTTLKNGSLKPMRTKSFETGLDVKLLQRRIGLEFTYYTAKTIDQIMNKTISYTSGFYNKVENVGEIQNSGIELVFDVFPIRTGDFEWNIRLTYAKNKSEVIKLQNEDDEIILSSWGARVVAKPGLDYGTIIGNDYARDENGNILIDDNGYPSGIVQDTILGKVQPDFTFGVSNSLTYKNFDFTFLIDGSIGGDLFSIFHYYGIPAGQLKESLYGREPALTGYVYEGVNENTGQPNTVGIPANYAYWGSTNYHSNFVVDASYVKLRSVSLGYTFNNDFLARLKISSIRLSAYGNNLLLLYSNVTHIDPETSIGGPNGSLFGMAWSATPSARTIGFNVKINL